VMGDAERTQDRQTDMQKVEIGCAGCSDGDAQQPHCLFSLSFL
jgi:hypothetical protein